MKPIALVIVTMGGIGYLPASGTLASALTAAFYFFVLGHMTWYYQFVLLFAVTLVATLLCHFITRRSSNKDPSEIVIDEFAGMWLALVFVPVSLLYVCLIFLCFRVLDIFKPGPIGWIDRNVSGGWGIMLDDLVAGALCIPFALAFHLV